MEYFSIGRVFSRAFGIIRDTATSVGLFILIIVLIEAAISYLAQSAMMGNLSQIMSSAGRFDFDGLTASLISLGSVAGLVIMGIAWAGGVGGMLKYAQTGAVSLQDCVEAAIAKFLPVLAVIVLYWIGFAIGWLFIIVPGVILACMWAVSVPAQLAEGLGVFEAFGRSRDLTRGNRLSIFGILLILIIVYYVVSFVVMGSMFSMGTFTGPTDMDDIERFSQIGILISLPLGWITGMVIKAFVTALYLETVAVKGGGTATHVAGVFD